MQWNGVVDERGTFVKKPQTATWGRGRNTRTDPPLS